MHPMSQLYTMDSIVIGSVSTSEILSASVSETLHVTKKLESGQEVW